MLFILLLICTARVIDCIHQPQRRHQQILYSTSLNVKLVHEKKNRSLLFSGSRKIPTLGITVQRETQQDSFLSGMVGPPVGIFLSPLNTSDGFYFSRTPDRYFCCFYPSGIFLSHIPTHIRSSDPYVSSVSEKSVPHPYLCEISVTNAR